MIIILMLFVRCLPFMFFKSFLLNSCCFVTAKYMLYYDNIFELFVVFFFCFVNNIFVRFVFCFLR